MFERKLSDEQVVAKAKRRFPELDEVQAANTPAQVGVALRHASNDYVEDEANFNRVMGFLEKFRMRQYIQ